MPYVSVGAMVLCGLVLLVSAVSKVRSAADYAEFVASVPAFGIPAGWTGLFALATVAAEFAITALVLPASVLMAVGISAGRWLAGAGLLLAVGLFGVLTAAVWRAVTRRSGAVCRCFGPARTPLSQRHVVRNALLLLVAVLGAATLSVMDSVDPVVAAVTAVIGLLGALMVIRFDDLAELFAGPVSTR
ncbi:ABC-type dipeptide/oligopeptide/nickel transport system permease component [Kibdelosporangium banguiense]|uniref:ABC-type dipeptide/oligopeptide/nickel transport system permease component n=1 Tax=Kibdelosporangium banguiense TaxID=1365924 RepID=A0ABS4TKV9_9PSEU|nr:MauE/DoxX family redox-associated membrane protein [Kibdelosporangium banguiense]MBP2325035.1 ABC-type dipeptide/oligopeptide/nickel transport system permease component [Kibdelosporangium banguiense]